MRVRDERGQGSVEYAGALALLAIVFGVLTATDVPGKVKDTVGPAVCRIVGGDCSSGTTSASAAKKGGGRPTARAATAGGGRPKPIDLSSPFPVLPYPGSYEVSCSYGANVKKCDPGGISAGHKRGRTLERSETTLDDRGCPGVTLGVKGTLELFATAGGKAKAGGSMTGIVGSATAYSITVPPGQLGDIQKLKRAAPNPIDPRTIRKGESVELSQEFYKGARMTAEYRALQVEMGFDEGRKLSAGVQRTDANTVRITVGDKDFVRDVLNLGISAGPVGASLNTGGELSRGKTHQIDVDISSAAGWKAYQSFLTSGKLPASGAPGTANAGSSQVVEFKDSTVAKAQFGRRAVSRILSESGSTGIETRYADGRVTNSFVGHTGDVGVVVNTETKNGQTVPKQYSLTLENADPKTVARYESATGRSLNAKDGNVRFDFTPADFARMREQALDQVVQQAEQSGNPVTKAQARKLIAEDRKEGSGLNEPSNNAFEIASAQTDDEVLLQLYLGSGPNRNPNQALDGLLDFQRRTVAAQNGGRDFPSEHPGALLPGGVKTSCGA